MNEDADRCLDDICEASAASAQTPGHPGRVQQCLNEPLLEPVCGRNRGTRRSVNVPFKLSFLITMLFPDLTYGKNIRM